MVTRRRALWGILAVVVLGGLAAFAGWYYFFGQSAPRAASIDDAANVVRSTAPGGASGAPSGDVTGTWTVDNAIGSYSDYTNSWAGFRVAEVLDNIGDATAIGRTPGVSGQVTLDGQTLTGATINVVLTSITSNESRRDPAIQRTLETSSFPTAVFALTQPVSLPQAPTDGVTYNVTAQGDMTIHGITKSVAVDLQAQLKNGVIAIVGSTPFSFADYGMTPPRAPIVLSVADQGTIEFQLFLTKG